MIDRLVQLTKEGDVGAAQELLVTAHRASDTHHRLLALDIVGRHAWTRNDPGAMLDWLLKVSAVEALACAHRVRLEWFGADMRGIPASLAITLHRFRHGVPTTDLANSKLPLRVECCRKPGKGKRMGPPIRGGWSLLSEVSYYEMKNHETLAEYVEAIPIVLVQVCRKIDGRLTNNRIQQGGAQIVAKRGDPVEWGNRVFLCATIARVYTNLYKETPDSLLDW